MIRSRSKCMPSIVLLVLIGTEEWTEKDKLNYVNWTLKKQDTVRYVWLVSDGLI